MMTQPTASGGAATPATAVHTTVTAHAARGPQHVNQSGAVPDAPPVHNPAGTCHGIHGWTVLGRRA
jgi:hypothetical protein